MVPRRFHRPTPYIIYGESIIDHKNLFKPVVKEVKSRNGSSQSFLFLKVTPPLRAERIIQKELSFFFCARDREVDMVDGGVWA